jgi:hypothetical protein
MSKTLISEAKPYNINELPLSLDPKPANERVAN